MTKHQSETTNDDIMAMLSQFATAIDSRFDTSEKKFDRLEGRFDKLEKKFDRLDQKLAVIEHTVNESKKDIAKIQKDVNNIYNILDAHMARIDSLIQESMVQKHQYERIERWIFQIADKTGIQLKYD